MNLLTKKANFALLKSGFFGNTAPQWENVDVAIKEWGKNKPIVCRSRIPCDVCYYDKTITELMEMGISFENRYFNPPINKEVVTLNAEVMHTSQGIYLYYATISDHMRPALRRNGKHAYGITALTIMRYFCCPRGFDCIMELLDIFEGHVIEFTCLEESYGILGWHTVIWEVRKY